MHHINFNERVPLTRRYQKKWDSGQCTPEEKLIILLTGPLNPDRYAQLQQLVPAAAQQKILSSNNPVDNQFLSELVSKQPELQSAYKVMEHKDVFNECRLLYQHQLVAVRTAEVVTDRYVKYPPDDPTLIESTLFSVEAKHDPFIVKNHKTLEHYVRRVPLLRDVDNPNESLWRIVSWSILNVNCFRTRDPYTAAMYGNEWNGPLARVAQLLSFVFGIRQSPFLMTLPLRQEYTAADIRMNDLKAVAEEQKGDSTWDQLTTPPQVGQDYTIVRPQNSYHGRVGQYTGVIREDKDDLQYQIRLYRNRSTQLSRQYTWVYYKHLKPQ